MSISYLFRLKILRFGPDVVLQAFLPERLHVPRVLQVSGSRGVSGLDNLFKKNVFFLYFLKVSIDPVFLALL
jgi:hypothetical protein